MHDNSEYSRALAKLLQLTTNPKLGLSRIEALLEIIGFDRSAMRVIQVVGTNGKGSTSAYVESILQEFGISSGLFTSPHLCSARERIRINGEPISEQDFVLAADLVLLSAAKLTDKASFFECFVAMAMWIMQKHKVKVAILEAGLGGRLCATTAVKADILGITSIDFDHQNILGNTIAAITREKIAAARAGQRVITVAQHEESIKALKSSAQKIGCDLTYATLSDLPLGLYGDHQRINAGLAVALTRELFADIRTPVLARGLMKVKWPGRFEIIDANATPIVLDGAHNPAGINTLVNALRSHDLFCGRSLVLVYGSLNGPNVIEKIRALKSSNLSIKHIYLHQPKNPRALDMALLREAFLLCGFKEDMLCDYTAMATVKAQAAFGDKAIVVCGSLYTIGEIRSELLGIAMDFGAPNF